ncbi:Pleckstrin_homology domain [Hexamita inflata]|uniref:Pleckstrin homology domain n=1 Tax=Hexamita inflata TaxID=28002 RepID=A0AA86U5F2_9EUKA|nr:Pleckstrin homology domain [Hexamita inflata]
MTNLLKASMLLKLGGPSKLQNKMQVSNKLSIMNHWDMRYCELTNTEFSWYEAKNEKKCNSIEISSIKQIIRVLGRHLEKNFVFRITTPKKSYIFAVDCHEAQIEWTNILQELSGVTVQDEVSV